MEHHRFINPFQQEAPIVAILIAGWLISFADDAADCMPAAAMREQLTSEGFALDHPHTGLDGRRYEFWAKRSDSTAVLLELRQDGEACVADTGFLYRGGRYDGLHVAQ